MKGIAGFYFVKSGETVYRCKARGIFKQNNIKPAVGDKVEFEIIEGNDDSLVTEIFPRKNSFIRPFVANVDCFAVVTAVAQPAPVMNILDKFLVMAENAGTEIILCINKCDLADENGKGSRQKAFRTLQVLKETYEPVYPVVLMNGITGEGTDRLKELISGKNTALAGPSGVGKSTILNRLIPGADMETGSISKKSQRGKHTTRHSELFELDSSSGTMIFDTPGFTSFELTGIDEANLQYMYPDIAMFAGKCRFDNCRHLSEPGCGVKEALAKGMINTNRYESYKQQMEELRK